MEGRANGLYVMAVTASAVVSYRVARTNQHRGDEQRLIERVTDVGLGRAPPPWAMEFAPCLSGASASEVAGSWRRRSGPTHSDGAWATSGAARCLDASQTPWYIRWCGSMANKSEENARDNTRLLRNPLGREFVIPDEQLAP